MSLAEPLVHFTDHGDGSADFTITIDDEDHKFSASAENGKAVVQYEETQSWRGVIRVAEPRNEVFRALMSSEEMTEFLETYRLDGVRREKHH